MKNVIVLTTNKEGFQTLLINNKRFDSTLDQIFDIQQKLIGKININEFPKDTVIRPYKNDTRDGYSYAKMPIELKNLGHGKTLIEIEACMQTIGPGYIISTERFQTLKAEHILTQNSFNPKITIFDVDDTTAHLHYTIELPEDKVDNLIKSAMEFDKDVTVRVLDSMKNVENDIRKNLGLALLV